MRACADTRIDNCIEMCIGARADMSVDIFIGICVEMCVGMRMHLDFAASHLAGMHMCTDVCVDMCVDMCT